MGCALSLRIFGFHASAILLQRLDDAGENRRHACPSPIEDDQAELKPMRLEEVNSSSLHVANCPTHTLAQTINDVLLSSDSETRLPELLFPVLE